MGCDIHAYIQYKEKKSASNYWQGFGGEIILDRSYMMFGVLAGVRDSPKYYHEPKGLPEHLSWQCEGDLYLQITETGAGDNEITLEGAQNYHRPIIKNDKGVPYKVQHPDWHSFSWLTTSELKQAYKWYKKETGYAPGLQYRVLLKILKELENKDKNEAILVFWFDN